MRHSYGMTTTIRVDRSNRLVLSRDLRRAAGIVGGQTLKASAVPGRIVLEAEPNRQGKIVRRGKLRVWSGPVPRTPLADAIDRTRHYQR
jgi:hypothetical protein